MGLFDRKFTNSNRYFDTLNRTFEPRRSVPVRSFLRPSRPHPFSSGVSSLFDGRFGGMGPYNPYQQPMPMMGRFGGRFNPMMGGGFNPYMGGRFNPMMGGGFRPRGRFESVTPPGFEGYDFNTPIGEAPGAAQPIIPPSMEDRFSAMNEDQRNNFLNRFNLVTKPTPITLDERDMIDSGSIPGRSGFSIEQDRSIPSLTGIKVIDDYNKKLATPPKDGLLIQPEQMPGGQFEIPGVDLEKIRESLGKIEPMIPGVSLPEPQPVSAPNKLPQFDPNTPMPSIDELTNFDTDNTPFGTVIDRPPRIMPLRRMPPPAMPLRRMPPPAMSGPLPRAIPDPVMTRPAPIRRGIGGIRGVRGMPQRRR
jgi:hypothetical protein